LGPAWATASAQRKRAEVIGRRAALVRVRRAWEGIEAFALPGLKWTLNPGLTEADVRKLEVCVCVCVRVRVGPGRPCGRCCWMLDAVLLAAHASSFLSCAC
jgi:hypothetical protein